MNQKKYEQTLIKLVIQQIKFELNQNEDENLEKLLQSMIEGNFDSVSSMIKGHEKDLIAYVSTEYPEEFKRDMKSRKDWFVEGVIKA